MKRGLGFLLLPVMLFGAVTAFAAPLPGLGGDSVVSGVGDYLWDKAKEAAGDYVTDLAKEAAGDLLSYAVENAGEWFPELGDIASTISGALSMPLPNIAYKRVLWMFSGESTADTAIEIFQSVFNSDMFSSLRNQFSEIGSLLSGE